MMNKLTVAYLLENLYHLSTGVSHGIISRHALIYQLRKSRPTSIPSGVSELERLVNDFLEEGQRHNLCYSVGFHHWKYGCRPPLVSKLSLQHYCSRPLSGSGFNVATNKLTLSQLMEKLYYLSTGIEHGVVVRQALIVHLKQQCPSAIPSDTVELELLVDDLLREGQRRNLCYTVGHDLWKYGCRPSPISKVTFQHPTASLNYSHPNRKCLKCTGSCEQGLLRLFQKNLDAKCLLRLLNLTTSEEPSYPSTMKDHTVSARMPEGKISDPPRLTLIKAHDDYLLRQSKRRSVSFPHMPLPSEIIDSSPNDDISRIETLLKQTPTQQLKRKVASPTKATTGVNAEKSVKSARTSLIFKRFLGSLRNLTKKNSPKSDRSKIPGKTLKKPSGPKKSGVSKSTTEKTKDTELTEMQRKTLEHNISLMQATSLQGTASMASNVSRRSIDFDAELMSMRSKMNSCIPAQKVKHVDVVVKRKSKKET